MKFKELKKSLISKVEPVYLLCGSDAFFLEHSIKLICDKCLEQPDLNLTKFDGNEVKGNVDKLLGALSSYPFLSEKRVVIVKEYYPLSLDLQSLGRYCDKPNETSVLIICNSLKSDAIQKLSSVTYVDCNKGDDGLLSAWIKSECQKSGVDIDDISVRLINEYCLGDMTRISGEVTKLISYVGQGGKIDETVVVNLCAKETDYELYEIVEFIANRNYDKAYSSFLEIARQTADGQKLYTSLYGYFRRLLYSAMSDLTNEEIASQLKVKEYAIVMAKKQASKFSVKRVKEIVDYLANNDFKFKEGYIEQNSALYNSVFKVLIG